MIGNGKKKKRIDKMEICCMDDVTQWTNRYSLMHIYSSPIPWKVKQ
jgi:hypothetical protein